MKQARKEGGLNMLAARRWGPTRRSATPKAARTRPPTYRLDRMQRARAWTLAGDLSVRDRGSLRAHRRPCSARSARGKTSCHAGQCEFVSETDAAVLRVILKVKDGAGGD